MPGPSLGGAAVGDDWLVREVQDLRRELTEMRAARTLEASSIGAGGLQVVNGGSIKFIAPNGTVIAILGALPPQFNRIDGTPQQGVIFNREDGTTAMVLADVNPTTNPIKQAFQIQDRSLNIVIADDTNSGFGIARPHMPKGVLMDTNTATWPATTSATYVAIADTYWEIEQPRLSWIFYLEADAGTTGQFQLMMNGTQIGTTQTLAGGAGGAVTTWSDLVTVTSFGWGAILPLQIMAKRTAGAGSVRARQVYLSGTQS